MAIETPKSDLSRTKNQESDQIWPHQVKISIYWRDDRGRVTVGSEIISAAQFFGNDGFGAPLTGDFVISLIERMRRAGPPVKIKTRVPKLR